MDEPLFYRRSQHHKRSRQQIKISWTENGLWHLRGVSDDTVRQKV